MLPSLPLTVTDIVEEYEEKLSKLKDTINDFDLAFDRLQSECVVNGTFVDPIGSKSYLSETSISKNLLKSGWKAAYNRLNIDHIVSAKDKQMIERSLADPPELTVDNVRATFGDYLVNSRFHILKGLAEAFCDLDKAYKSHSNVKIGVKGLPKRVILRWGEYNYGYGYDKFENMVNALASYQGKPMFEYSEKRIIVDSFDKGEDAILDGSHFIDGKPTVDRGLRIKKFANGNVHVFFSELALIDINKALAEFYGEVLPDVDEKTDKPKSTEVAKDLQFYYTPDKVIDRLLNIPYIREGFKVLEPSCGDGRIMDALREYKVDVFGFEYHPGRAAEARAKGHSVVTANFLEQVPTEDFDLVIINPPFYGQHYLKHIEHALKFLKPGGELVSVLPATAWYDHKKLKGEWWDLPVASFSECGTNVPTGIIRIRK